MSYYPQEPWGGDNESMAEINVTPLVDVMLVLLITFMIAMPVLTYTIAIDLPTNATQEKDNIHTEPLRLTIDQKGRYYLDKEEITLEDLDKVAKARLSKNEDVILAVSADQGAEYKYVANALISAQRAGIKKIGFVTEKTGPDQ